MTRRSSVQPVAYPEDFAKAMKPRLRYFSRLRWIVLCLCGLRHREDWFQVARGRKRVKVDRCSRCGVLVKGRMSL